MRPWMESAIFFSSEFVSLWKGKFECFTMWIRIIDDGVKTSTDPSSKLGTCCLSRVTREYLHLPSYFLCFVLWSCLFIFLLIECSWTYFDRSASTSVGWLVSLSRFIYQLCVCVCSIFSSCSFVFLFPLSLFLFMYESIYVWVSLD